MQINQQVFHAISQNGNSPTTLTPGKANEAPQDYSAIKQFSLALLLVFGAATAGVVISIITRGGV